MTIKSTTFETLKRQCIEISKRYIRRDMLKTINKNCNQVIFDANENAL